MEEKNMSSCLIDANVFIAGYLVDDTQHIVGAGLLKSLSSKTKKINYWLVAEVATVLLLKSKNLSFTQKIIDDLFFSNQALISAIPISPELWQATHNVFVEQKKNKLSWADCSLIDQARLEDVQTIITLDKDLSKEVGREFKFIQSSS